MITVRYTPQGLINSSAKQIAKRLKDAGIPLSDGWTMTHDPTERVTSGRLDVISSALLGRVIYTWTP